MPFVEHLELRLKNIDTQQLIRDLLTSIQKKYLKILSEQFL